MSQVKNNVYDVLKKKHNRDLWEKKSFLSVFFSKADDTSFFLDSVANVSMRESEHCSRREFGGQDGGG